MVRAVPGSFDLVFLDPPFDSGLLDDALAAALRLVAGAGFIYLEARRALPAPPQGWAEHRSGRAGAVRFQLLRHADDGYTAGQSRPSVPRRTAP
jgi:16S rRNA (guanine966-N2)-methyltransferase